MTTMDDAEKVFEELDISEYDLRILDPDLPPASSSMILPKRNCTMMSLDSLSIIISEKYSLYIEKDENAMAIIEDISKRLQERIAYARSNRMSDEIFILDAILDIVLTMLRKNTLHWDSKAAPLVSKIERGISEEPLQKIKSVKSRLNRLILDTDTIKETISRGMADEFAERVKVILEIYYISFNVQTLKIRECLEDISNAENTHGARVDAQRNQILKFELVTLVFTLGLTVVSSISGIFGKFSHEPGHCKTEISSSVETRSIRARSDISLSHFVRHVWTQNIKLCVPCRSKFEQCIADHSQIFFLAGNIYLLAYCCSDSHSVSLVLQAAGDIIRHFLVA